MLLGVKVPWRSGAVVQCELGVNNSNNNFHGRSPADLLLEIIPALFCIVLCINKQNGTNLKYMSSYKFYFYASGLKLMIKVETFHSHNMNTKLCNIEMYNIFLYDH